MRAATRPSSALGQIAKDDQQLPNDAYRGKAGSGIFLTAPVIQFPKKQTPSGTLRHDHGN